MSNKEKIELLISQLNKQDSKELSDLLRKELIAQREGELLVKQVQSQLKGNKNYH